MLKQASNQNTAAGRFHPVFSPSPLLFLRRILAGAAFDCDGGAGRRVSVIRPLFEFDAVVWETVRAKVKNGSFFFQYRDCLCGRAVVFLSPCVLPLVPGYISLMSGVSVDHLKTEAAVRAER